MPTLPPVNAQGARYDGWPFGRFYTIRCTWCSEVLNGPLAEITAATFEEWAARHEAACPVREPPKVHR